jgi:hypothetical protein
MSGEPDRERARRSYPSGVTNSNAGGISGRAVQAGHIDTVNMYGGDHPKTGAAEGADEGTGPTWTPRKVIRVVVAVVLCLGILSLFPTPPDPNAIPGESGLRPAGATDEAILVAVKGSLVSCAQTRVLRQANCPQSVDDVIGQADDVHWTLHGDPVDGAYPPVWNNDRFYVAGYAVMTVAYTVPYQVPSPQGFKVQVVPYRAEVTWTDNKAAVTNLRRFDTIDKQRITKRDPGVSLEQVAPVVRAAFQRCAAATQSPMPAQCPSSTAAQASEHATWVLNGDPLPNSKQTFEASSGIVHVTGSYSATVTTRDQFLGMKYGSTTTQSGDYDASLILNGAELHLLQIRSV